MTWKPDLSTREEIGGFVQDLLAVLPDQLGIDEVIAGCEVLVIPAGAPPKYIDVALGGDAYAGPAVAGGKVYIIAHEGDQDVVRALDLNTGQEIWRFSCADTADAAKRAADEMEGPRLAESQNPGGSI